MLSISVPTAEVAMPITDEQMHTETTNPSAPRGSEAAAATICDRPKADVASLIASKVETIHMTSSEDILLKQYSRECYACYSDTIDGFVSLGRCLIEAKSKLSAQAWVRFTSTEQCPVSYTVATRYMKIAENDNIASPEHWLSLPLKWNVLYEISLLTKQQFDEGIEKGIIKRAARIDDIRLLAGKKPRAVKKEAPPQAPEAPIDAEEVARLATVVSSATVAQEAHHRDGTPDGSSGTTGDSLVAKRPSEETKSIAQRPHRVTIHIQELPTETLNALEQEIKRLLESYSLTESEVEVQ
jgi:hypothetical protein